MAQFKIYLEGYDEKGHQFNSETIRQANHISMILAGLAGWLQIDNMLVYLVKIEEIKEDEET
jgi:hypothetical protein